MRDQTNMRAIPLQNLEFDAHRTYLCVFAETDVIVTISSGSPFTIPADTHWGPQPAPMNDISFSGQGVVLVG